MALQSPFFGKRDADPAATPARTSTPAGGTGSSSSFGTSPAPSPAASGTASGTTSSSSGSTSGSSASPFGFGGMGAGSTPAPAPAADDLADGSATRESASKLTVGPNIKLKGVEITDCDTLVVEGTVEATMDSRVIRIAEHGAFKGSAEIDIAEIRGTFEGTLTVREKLVIHATGRVSGTVRYGRIVIEEGGQLSGEVSMRGATGSTAGTSVGTASGTSAATTARTPSSAA